jgi:hypothetical protein
MPRSAPPTAPPTSTAPQSNPRLDELLSRITELSDDELNELADIIRSTFDASANPDPNAVMSADSLDQLEMLAAGAKAVNRERQRRDENVTRGHEAEQLLASFHNPGRRHAIVPTDRRPRPSYANSARAVTASGQPIGDRDELANEFLAAMRQQRAPNASNGRVLVATIASDRPSAKTLFHNDSAEVVTAALDAATAAQAQRISSALAVTAAGGLAAPEQVDYVLPGFEVNDRPVTQSLPAFTTERGGVRFMRPPALADVDGAVGVWTVADDIDAATDPDVRKPSLRVVFGDEIVVDTQAVTSILTFGNMMARSYPEMVARVTDLAMVAHSRLAEQQVLTQIGALSTSVSGAAGEGDNLGATRVLLPLLDRAATGMRNRLRTDPSAPLQLILPHWAAGILRTDLALQEPGDAREGVTDAELVAYLASRNLSPTWALDGETGQSFDPQEPGDVNAWPASIVSYLFPVGAFQFLDGGTLDLGLVRDSTLNAANDFQMFTESFEAVLFRGGEALRVSQAVTPNGIARAAAAAS